MPQAKSDLEWLKGHLNTLVDVGSRVRVIDPDIFNEFGSWTALKLIGVKYWQSVYSTIIPEYLRELGRDSMALLLHAPCDIWFTYFPNIKRSFVLSEYDDANLEVCRAFFGRDLVDGATTYEELVGAWLDHLRRYREFVYPFTIQSGQGYYYLLVFLTRMTRGDSPYVRAAADLDRRISAIHGDFVQTVLRILSKGQTQLDMY